MSITLAAILLIAAALLIGAALLAAGLRGRTINDHPVCRRCRFDLVGVYPKAAACPECGADLAPPRAVVKGQRQRRRTPAVAGSVLLAASAAGIGALAWASLTGFDWNTVKPARLLVSELSSRDPARADAAAKELFSRHTAGALDPAHAAAALDRILERQADAAATWVDAYGDLVEVLWIASLLTDDHWERYISNAAALTVRTRASVRRGGPIDLHAQLATVRVGSTFTGPLFGKVRYRLVSATVDGEELPPNTPHAWGAGAVDIRRGSTAFSRTALPPRDTPGTFTLRSTWELTPLPHDTPVHQTFRFSEDGVEVVVPETGRERLVEFVHQITVTDSTDPAVRMLESAEMDEWIRRELEVRSCKLIAHGRVSHGLTTEIRLPRPPMNLAATVTIVAEIEGERIELPPNNITARSDAASQGFSWMFTPTFPNDTPMMQAEDVTFIIRGSAAVAEETVDMDEAWGGVVEITGVRVERP